MSATELTTMSCAASNVAIIFGVTGLVGRELAKTLISKSKWKVYGVAREPDVNPPQNPRYEFIACDLLNPLETKQKLSMLDDVTHIYWITWATQFPLDTKDCCEQNKSMMSNALDCLIPNSKSLKHVSLQTGMKHYVSLQGPWSSENDGVVCYNEENPRVGDGKNFYYVLEDLIKEKVRQLYNNNNVYWSVIRPGLLMGCSKKSLYNFIGSLCVYGSICKYLQLPFVFGGTKECWESFYIDGSDARLVAEQHIWASEVSSVIDGGQAFNSINGGSFTWEVIWSTIGKKFGVEGSDEMLDEGFLYTKAMSGKEEAWEEIVVSEGLVVTKMEDLADWGFLDVLFRFPMKMVGSREKGDAAGFLMRYETLDSILYWIDVMRDENLIP